MVRHRPWWTRHGYHAGATEWSDDDEEEAGRGPLPAMTHYSIDMGDITLDGFTVFPADTKQHQSEMEAAFDAANKTLRAVPLATPRPNLASPRPRQVCNGSAISPRLGEPPAESFEEPKSSGCFQMVEQLRACSGSRQRRGIAKKVSPRTPGSQEAKQGIVDRAGNMRLGVHTLRQRVSALSAHCASLEQQSAACVGPVVADEQVLQQAHDNLMQRLFLDLPLDADAGESSGLATGDSDAPEEREGTQEARRRYASPAREPKRLGAVASRDCSPAQSPRLMSPRLAWARASARSKSRMAQEKPTDGVLAGGPPEWFRPPPVAGGSARLQPIGQQSEGWSPSRSSWCSSARHQADGYSPRGLGLAQPPMWEMQSLHPALVPQMPLTQGAGFPPGHAASGHAAYATGAPTAQLLPPGLPSQGSFGMAPPPDRFGSVGVAMPHGRRVPLQPPLPGELFPTAGSFVVGRAPSWPLSARAPEFPSLGPGSNLNMPPGQHQLR